MKKMIIGVTIACMLAGGLYFVDQALFKVPVEEAQETTEEKPVINQGENKENQEKPNKDNQQKENQIEVGIRKGHIAADFTLPNLNNQSESLWDYRGKKIILNFWSADCPPCREEMPDLNEYYLQHKDQNVVVLGVGLGQSVDDTKNFIKKNNYEFPVLVDPNNSVAYAYGVVYLPTTYIIDEEGVIQQIHVGILTKDDLDRYMK